MTFDEEIIKCPICRTVIEDVYLFPDLIARSYKWTRTANGRNESYWYYSKHSIEEITDFQEKQLK